MLVPHLIRSTPDVVEAALTGDDAESPVAVVCRKLPGQAWEPINAITPDGPGELPTCFELSRAAIRALDEILQVA